MAISNQVKFGTVILGGTGNNTIESMPKTKVPGTIKGRFNETLTLTEIPGRAKDRLITINGNLIGTNRDSDRNTLKNYDDGSPRRYEDGDDDGDYCIISGTLIFDIKNINKTKYPYSMDLIEYNQ